MRFSCQWLDQYVELPAVDELSRRLTGAGLNVELVERLGEDTVLDIDVTTNRPDCMNHLGLTREIAVLFDQPVKRPPVEPPKVVPSGELATVVIDDLSDCARYVGLVIRDVEVGPSPEWLTRRLEAVGLRPINNVVDVTNYVLWEYGQPLHAFDLDTLEQKKIVVRRAKKGEELHTLDGEKRKLGPEILVIADARRAVALAGIMGGAETEVGDSTVNVLLESAHFDRRTVRRGTSLLDLRTDASHRFERGTDPEACLEAAARAAGLIVELAGGEILAAVDNRSSPEVFELRGSLSLAKLEAFAGASIPAAAVERWLDGLGFAPRAKGEGEWEVAVPSWRYYDFLPTKEEDRVWEADLYEEVLRLYGFDRIASALPALSGPDGVPAEGHLRRDRVRDHLAACGYAEAINFAFYDPESDRSYPGLVTGGSPLPLANPLSERHSVMRRSLLPNLVESARFNQRRGAPAVRLFEVGHVFFEGGGEGREELDALGVVAGGELGSPWDRHLTLDLFDLKGALESLAAAFAVELRAHPAELPGLMTGTAAELVSEGKVVGYLGRAEAGEEAEDFPLYVAELDLRALPVADAPPPVELPSRYPGITADLTLTHALSLPWVDLAGAIRDHAPSHLVRFALKDRYQGEGVPEGAVNTTISFHYNARDRSLTQDEVNDSQAALAQLLEKRFAWRG